MWPFLALASSVAVAAATGSSKRPNGMLWLVFLIAFTLFVGLRHNVGMDWNNYLRMIDEAGRVERFDQLLGVSEPLYALLLILGDRSGFGMYAVNLVASLAFMIGLFRFCRLTPEPWLAVMVSMPVYVIVVAMSANRQALAAGLLMWLVADWYRLSPIKRTLWIFFAAGFHFSALLFLVFVGIDLRVRLWIKFIALSFFVVLIIYILQSTGQADYYDSAYGRGQTEATQSSGALMHVSVNAIPALLYILLPKYRPLFFPTPLMREMAIAAIVTLPLAIVASAAAGRISLYWYPVSIWVWSAVPLLFKPRVRPIMRILISMLMITIMIAWLTLANSSRAHIPYQNALFVYPWELQIGYVP